MPAQKERDRDKAEAIAWARRVLASRSKYVILDIGGVEPSDPTDEIKSIAISTLDGKIILDQQLRASDDTGSPLPTLEKIWPQVKEAISGCTILVYNEDYIDSAFDATRDAQPRVGALSFDCVMEHYAAFVNKWSAKHEEYTWQKLPGAAEDNPAKDCIRILEVLITMAEATPPVVLAAPARQPFKPGFWSYIALYFVIAYALLVAIANKP